MSRIMLALLIATCCSVLPALAAPAEGGNFPQWLSPCSCYCHCVRFPKTGGCSGSGTCCKGKEAVWFPNDQCRCHPCWFIFGGEIGADFAARKTAACTPPDQRYLDRHLAALRSEATGFGS